jgi:glutamyl/glutaminyl-tRNA synthetase
MSENKILKKIKKKFNLYDESFGCYFVSFRKHNKFETESFIFINDLDEYTKKHDDIIFYDDITETETIPACNIIYFSKYIDIIKSNLIKFIEEGLAYVELLSFDEVKYSIDNRIQSSCSSDNDPDHYLNLFNCIHLTELNNDYCVRLRINYDDENINMRDPIIYKTNRNHYKFRNLHKFYPSMIFSIATINHYELIDFSIVKNNNYDKDVYNWIMTQLNKIDKKQSKK